MLPEIRKQFVDLIEGLVSANKVVWDGAEIRLASGWEEWDIIELTNVWNGVSWYPNVILTQLLDLITALQFERAALAHREVRGNELNWVYAKFLDLKRARDKHIAQFDEPRPPRTAYEPQLVKSDILAWKRVAKR